MRNDVAHEPTKFTRSVDDVRLVIDGIWQLLGRVS
jgi:hypothetical protein